MRSSESELHLRSRRAISFHSGAVVARLVVSTQLGMPCILCWSLDAKFSEIVNWAGQYSLVLMPGNDGLRGRLAGRDSYTMMNRTGLLLTSFSWLVFLFVSPPLPSDTRTQLWAHRNLGRA